MLHNETNDAGFVIFSARDYSYRGDKDTWARYDAATRRLTICRAARGIMSSAYIEEITAFCRAHGIDFSAIRCGERQTVQLADIAE